MIITIISEAFSRLTKNYRTALILGLFLTIIRFFELRFSFFSKDFLSSAGASGMIHSQGVQQFLSLIIFLISSYICLVWFRKLLLDEPFSFANKSNLGSRYWKYLLTAFLLILICVGPVFLLVFIEMLVLASFSLPGIFLVNILILLVIVPFYYFPLTLVLPARAIDDPIRLVNIYRKTKGKRSILGGSVILLTIPFITFGLVMMLGLGFILEDLNSSPYVFSGVILILAILSSVSHLMTYSLMTVLYERFIQEKNQTEA